MIQIALVDDHKIYLEGLVSVLNCDQNINILFSETNANTALERLKEVLPDLLITDISMPEMNGLEFIKILKRDYPYLKILVLSMFQNLNSLKDIDGFLFKETNILTLICTIKEIVIENKKHFDEIPNKVNLIGFKNSILSSREKEIIQLIAQELTTEEIADKLFISKHTIEAHRKNIFLKLNVKNIAGLVNVAIRLGVIRH